MHKSSSLTDIDTPRKRAGEHIDDDSVTASHLAGRDAVLKLLNASLAGGHTKPDKVQLSGRAADAL